jgi:hypothetical protein
MLAEDIHHILSGANQQLFVPSSQIKDPIDWSLGFEHVSAGLESYATTGNGMTIKEAFLKNCPNLVADRNLVRALSVYASRFRSKNQDHISFFGGNLIGVYPIKFTIADRNEWFDTILDTDEVDLTNDVHGTMFVNPKFHVTGDLFNLSMPVLLHLLHHSKHLNSGEIEQGKMDVVRIFHYKNLSSILSHDYPYPANKSVAMETYRQLSKKFDLKQYGSWQALIDARAKSIITQGTGIHYETYVRMTDDKAVIYMVGDVQDRLRDVINSINNVFHQVKMKENMITEGSSSVELDGVKHIRDVERVVSTYLRYVQNIVGVESDWYRPELATIIIKSNPTIPPAPLETALRYISSNYRYDKSGMIDELLKETIQHLFEYVASKNLKLGDVPDVVSKMKGAYRSSRTSNESLLKMRELGDEIVSTATGIRTAATVASVRVGLFLYIILRALSMKHYSS